MNAHQSICLDETLAKFQEADGDLFRLLTEEFDAYATKNGKRLVISRLSRALNITDAAVQRRLAALREILVVEDR